MRKNVQKMGPSSLQKNKGFSYNESLNIGLRRKREKVFVKKKIEHQKHEKKCTLRTRCACFEMMRLRRRHP